MPKFMKDYVITKCCNLSQSQLIATIRVNIDCRSDAEDWLQSFQEATRCDYRVAWTKIENSSRLVYKVKFI